MNNLELWQSVEETDPNKTKGFSRGGGFSGTAIVPLYLDLKATEQFGPIGKGWGFSIANEEYNIGHTLKNGDKSIIHKIQIQFWYKLDGEKYEFPAFGQTTFLGENKYGSFTDEEAPKKSLTDAWTKALSLLGFSADVHMGKYDDSKYLNDLKAKYKDEGNQSQTSGSKSKSKRFDTSKYADKNLLSQLKTATAAADMTLLELNAYMDKCGMKYKGDTYLSRYEIAIEDIPQLIAHANDTAKYAKAEQEDLPLS